MAYTKNVWKDQDVQRPRTYEVINNQDSTITLNDSFGVVTEIGTPVNATNMNHIEDGIKANDTAITTINGKIPSNASSSNKMVTQADLALKADLTDLDTKANITQLHALKGYEDAGELLTDAEGLSDVIKYAHSSFDRSKFTVVGTPNITDDGIASGFSNSNYLTIDNSDIGTLLHNANTWELTIPFLYTKATIDWVCPIASVEQSIRIYFVHKDQWRNITVGLSSNGTSNDILDAPTGFSNLAEGQYVLNLKFTGSQYLVTLYNNSGYNKTITITSSAKVFATSGFKIGSGLTGSSSDLKQFSITVGGKEVFSGNKTGIDTIKPDDYTVVGTPTISADGVALTGYGRTDNSNKFNSDTFNVLSNNQVFESIAYIEPVPLNYEYSSQGQSVTSYRLDNNYIRVYRTAINGSHYVHIEQQVNGTWAGSSYNTRWILGTNFAGWVKFKIYYDVSDTCYKCDCYTYDNGIATFVKTMICSYTGNAITGSGWSIDFVYGQYQNYGKMDLNSIRVFDNGNLVYQPCLKIPYTESKTGSKVVNAVYRDRVNDMASQFGYANYYTLDEDNGNFTLPQGELYGLIGRLQKLVDDEIGLPKATLSNTLNDNEIWLEGAEVSKLTYSKLYAIYGDDYGTPTDSANFVLPDCRDRVMQGIGSGGTFGYISAGLPNITGTVGVLGEDGRTVDGAFYYHSSAGPLSNDGQKDYNAGFDASRSSSIYGNSTTVQPPAIKVRFKTRFQ